MVCRCLPAAPALATLSLISSAPHLHLARFGTSSRNFLFAIALTSLWRKGKAGGRRHPVRADDGVDVVS